MLAVAIVARLYNHKHVTISFYVRLVVDKIDILDVIYARFGPYLYECNGVVERSNRTMSQAAESVKNGDHSRRIAAIRFYFLSRRQFSAHPKSSRSRIDKRTARATGNTRYSYSKIAPLDHKMADNCVSLARTNTVSSTITKPTKT